MRATGVPLSSCADEAIAAFARATGSAAVGTLDGTTLLCERAFLGEMKIPGRTSAGGGCRLFDAVGDTIALNLSRPSDRELLPALLETEVLATDSDDAIAAQIAGSDAAKLLLRGRSMGLAIASEHEMLHSVARPCIELVPGRPAIVEKRAKPRVVDLSALWAGPLAAHLLWLAGADVVKVESRTRPDAMREGDNTFYALLNQGKASVALDFANGSDRQALLSLIAASDIVIEAARPRALAQLGIDAEQIVRATPGLTWLTITGHGATGEAASWVGFGDDCGISGGLGAALHAASGRVGFVGDAIADPLTGMLAALAAWNGWTSQRGGRFGLAMSQVAAHCLSTARAADPELLESSLRAWSAAAGQPFPTVRSRPIGALAAFGENTRSCLAQAAR
jgi:hypothetical protein